MAKQKEHGGTREGAGRKAAVIDWDIVDNLLKAGCDGTEIAAHLGVHPETLYRHCVSEKKVDFAAYKQEKQAAGDALLRAAQYKLAINGKDKTMLVWLGKQRLGQTDKKSYDHTTGGESLNKPDLSQLTDEELELLRKLKGGE